MKILSCSLQFDPPSSISKKKNIPILHCLAKVPTFIQAGVWTVYLNFPTFSPLHGKGFLFKVPIKSPYCPRYVRAF